MEVQQIVLLEMKEGVRYNSSEIAKLTKLTVKQSGAALVRLARGGVISKHKNRHRWEYETKQQSLDV